MFQNITKDFEEIESQNSEDVKLDKKDNIKRVLYKILAKENIVLYIICFLISMVNFRLDSNINLSVFGLAILAAAMSNGIPIGIIYIVCGARNICRFWIRWFTYISIFRISTICKYLYYKTKNCMRHKRKKKNWTAPFSFEFSSFINTIIF